MTQELTTVSPLFSTPYLTIDEYKQAPTAIDVDDLVNGGSFGVNDQELANCIARASSWMDSHCNQVLGATLDTDTGRCRVSRDGFIRIHPRYNPIVEVVSASYGSNPTLMNTLDPTTAWLEQQSVIFPLSGIASSFLGSIQFSRVYSPLAQQFFSITYVNGYANALITNAVTANDPSIDLSDLTGFVPGYQFTIYDGAQTENLIVDSSFVPTQGPGTLLLKNPVSFDHADGVSASALPPAIKQAAIFMTNVILKARGNAGIVMTGLTPMEVQNSNINVASDYNQAVDLLKPFRRMR